MIRSRNHFRAVDSRVVAGLPATTNPSMVIASRAVPTEKRKEVARTQQTAMFDLLQGSNTFMASQIGASPVFYDSLMTGFASDIDDANLRFYRDIYWYDTVAGSAVDLIAAMPFSDLTLSGVEDSRLKVYNQAIEQLNLKTLFQELTVDMLVNGYSASSLVYDNKRSVFTDCISHDPMQMDRRAAPLRSMDPIITVRRTAAMQEFLASKSDIAVRMRQRVGAELLQVLKADAVELEPLFTLYVARKTFTHDQLGTSLYKRLLPIYFLEKALYKGTMTEAARRQRAMLHVEVGNDTWEPTNDELGAIVSLMQQADLDPLGAIVATRSGVQSNEIRQAGDFWKWTDLTDQMSTMKMRALGISEAFLSGDTTYASAETGLSVFLQLLRSHRERLTQMVLTNRVFPLVAASKDFRINNQKAETSFVSTNRSLMTKLNDTEMWDIPTVLWHKPLGKDTDREYYDMLKELREEGIPVTYRMLAAAAGVSLDGLEDDLRKQQKLSAVWDQIQGKDKKSNAKIEEDDFALSSLTNRSRALLSRKFQGSEIVGSTKTGKPKAIYNQTRAQQQADINIARAAVRLHSDPRYAAQCAKRAASSGYSWKA